MSQDVSSLEEILQSIAHIIAPEDVNRKISLDSKCPEGDTPLHIFVWRDEIENVRVLIQNGADINAVGDMGQTPLHVAVMQKNIAIAKALLESGASLSVSSEFGTTPLAEAKEIGGDIYSFMRKYASRQRL